MKGEGCPNTRMLGLTDRCKETTFDLKCSRRGGVKFLWREHSFAVSHTASECETFDIMPGSLGNTA